jgi:hypothetical protein
MWSGQVTGEEDELRKEVELEKGRQRERERAGHACGAAKSGNNTGHRGRYFAFLKNKNLDLPVCLHVKYTPHFPLPPLSPANRERRE